MMDDQVSNTNEEESVVRDILSELEKERIKRAEVEEKLRSYEYQVGDDLDQADRIHKLHAALDTFRGKTTESYHHINRDLNPILVRFFHDIFHSVDRLNSDNSNDSTTTASTNTTTTSIFGNKMTSSKNKANSTNSKKRIPSEDESLINEACAHVIQSYRKTNMLSKADIDVILKPMLEIAMEDFISTLADRWNKSLQVSPKNNKKDSSSFNASFNFSSSSSNTTNNQYHPSKRRSRINTSQERQCKHYENQIQTLAIQNQGLLSLLNTLTHTHPAISISLNTHTNTTTTTTTTTTPQQTSTSNTTKSTSNNNQSTNQTTKTLPLPIIQCLELMSWEERMKSYIQVSEKVVQWQVWDGRKRMWSNNKWNFPTEFQSLPVQEVEVEEEMEDGVGHHGEQRFHHGLSPSSSMDGGDGGGSNSSTTSIRTPTKSNNTKAATTPNTLEKGVRHIQRALESNITKECILLTDIHCSHILDLRHGYPLPTQGTWEWIGGWIIEECHDDGAGITGEDWKNGGNNSNSCNTNIDRGEDTDQEEEEEDVDTTTSGGVGTGKGGWSYTQHLPFPTPSTTSDPNILSSKPSSSSSSSSKGKAKPYTLFRHRSWKRIRVLTSYPGISPTNTFLLKQHAHSAKLTLSVDKLNRQVMSMQNQLMESESKRIEELENMRKELDKVRKEMKDTKVENTKRDRSSSTTATTKSSSKLAVKKSSTTTTAKSKEEEDDKHKNDSSAKGQKVSLPQMLKLNSPMLGIQVDVVSTNETGSDGNGTSSAVNTTTANKEQQINTTNGNATTEGVDNDPDATSTSTKSNDGDTVTSSATIVAIPAPTTTSIPQKVTTTDSTTPPNSSSSSVSTKTQPISSLFPTSTQTPSSIETKSSLKDKDKPNNKPNNSNNNNNSSQTAWMNMNRATTAGSAIFDTVRTNVVSNVVSLSTKARELPNFVAASTVVTGTTSSGTSNSNTTAGAAKKK